jgi:hypothetical protein
VGAHGGGQAGRDAFHYQVGLTPKAAARVIRFACEGPEGNTWYFGTYRP